MIVLIPAVSAWIHSGVNWTSTWLLVLWALCYCVQFTASRWCKSRFRQRYMKPAAVYTAVLCCLGIPFIMLHPAILWWAPLYIVLIAGSLLGAWMRRDHSLWANACAVLASSVMALIVTQYGSHAGRLMYFGTQPLPYEGVVFACVYAAMLYGSVLFVKTMIREYKQTSYLIASWIWHIACVILGFIYSPWLGALAVIWLARAIILPCCAWKKRLPAKYAGMTEVFVSLVTFCMMTFVPVHMLVG